MKIDIWLPNHDGLILRTFHSLDELALDDVIGYSHWIVSESLVDIFTYDGTPFNERDVSETIRKIKYEFRRKAVKEEVR